MLNVNQYLKNLDAFTKLRCKIKDDRISIDYCYVDGSLSFVYYSIKSDYIA